MDRGAWWAMVHAVRKSPTQLKRLSTAQKETRVEHVFDEIMAENFPNLEEETDIQVQEALMDREAWRTAIHGVQRVGHD